MQQQTHLFHERNRSFRFFILNIMNFKQTIRKKIQSCGVQSLSDAELLGFLLAHSGAGEDEANNLLAELGSIKAAVEVDAGTLIAQYGLNSDSAMLLKLIPAVCHAKSANNNSNRLINNTERAKNYFDKFFTGYTEEYFCAAAVKDNMRISDHVLLTSGSSLSVNAKCRDIVGFAVHSGMNKIIIAHNHPDANPSPSENDLIATEKIINALKPLGIKILDHIIVGSDSSLSLREMPGLVGFDEAPEYKTTLQMQNICKK